MTFKDDVQDAGDDVGEIYLVPKSDVETVDDRHKLCKFKPSALTDDDALIARDSYKREQFASF